MAKLVISPAYEIRRGKPTCNHKRDVYKVGGLIYEFCDECGICWVRRDGEGDSNAFSDS